MKKDYQDFLKSGQKTPEKLKQSVFSHVSRDLNPDHRVVFGKLVLVQGFVGIITMLFCPQFNMSLTNNYDVFHYLHHTFGEQICMIICGMIFLGTGAIFAASILNEGEIRKIKNSQFLYYSSLSILAVTAFIIFGAEVYIHLVSFWILGSIVGALSFFRLTNILKSKLV